MIILMVPVKVTCLDILDVYFGIRLKAAKNRNTLIEQSTTLIEHPS